MQDAEIYEKLTEIFHDVFDDESIVITPDTTAEDIADWNSLTHVNLTIACETAFGIRFKAAELEELHRVGDLVAMIKAKIS